jgi:hypothetical protein
VIRCDDPLHYNNGSILCTDPLDSMLRRCMVDGRTNSVVFFTVSGFCKSTAVLHNICTLLGDLEQMYFDGSDSGQGFPRLPLAEYEKSYPLDKIVCPRCKKLSQGVFVPKDKCSCYSMSLIDQAPISLLAREPNIRNNMKSSDPHTRREAYRRLLFAIKPDDFVV